MAAHDTFVVVRIGEHAQSRVSCDYSTRWCVKVLAHIESNRATDLIRAGLDLATGLEASRHLTILRVGVIVEGETFVRAIQEEASIDALFQT